MYSLHGPTVINQGGVHKINTITRDLVIGEDGSSVTRGNGTGFTRVSQGE